MVNVRYGAQILAAAVAHNLDPRLLAAVAAQETGGPGSNSGRNIVGDGGHGHGIFQIDDRSWGFARTPAAMDPQHNANMAATILADNLRTYGGDLRSALSAYNAGSPHAIGSRTTWGDGKILGYADSVMRHYAALGAPAAAPPPGHGTVNVPFSPPAPLPQPLIAADRFDAMLRDQAVSTIVPIAGSGASFGSAAAYTGATASNGFSAPPSGAAPAMTAVSWSQLTQAGSSDGQAADRALADLIDGSDDAATGDA